MRDLRSTAAFRSNIYPTSTNGDLANDRRFLDAISDPKALDILWRYGGSEGSRLNPLQRRQHDMAKHCTYAEEGDYPWGTPVGSNRVVCLCEKTDCPRYLIECSKFHPEGFVPATNKSKEIDAPNRTPSNRTAQTRKSRSVKGSRPTITRQQTETPPAQTRKPQTPVSLTSEKKTPATPRSSFSFVSPDTIEQRSRQDPKRSEHSKPQSHSNPQSRATSSRLRPWTAQEDSILKEMYPTYGISVRKWTKKLPGRSVEEILDRAHALKVRYIPQRERNTKDKEVKQKKAKSGYGNPKAERKKYLKQMRNSPWKPSEDAIIRKNYPIHGSNVNKWSQGLQYRSKKAIEARAKQLGLNK